MLGVGGFGLTYLATTPTSTSRSRSRSTCRRFRAAQRRPVGAAEVGSAAQQTFKWGLKRFLDESRTLASFRHPNIVRVMRFFEANQTAYMVMEFVAGESLNDWIKQRRPLERGAAARDRACRCSTDSR